MPTSTDRQYVSRSSDVPPPVSMPMLHRKCACGSHTQAGAAPSIVHEAIREPGRPLDPDARAMMESQFGQDFSFVRVHTGARAEASARAVHASAYTVGRDVVFGKGRYTPHDSGGQKLLAHELAHVVQQDGIDARGALGSGLRFGDTGDERFADRAADAVARGERVPDPGHTQAGIMLQRQDDDLTERVAAGPSTEEPLQTGGGTAQRAQRASGCRTGAGGDARLPTSGTFRASTGNGWLPTFCVTRSRVQLTIRGDWREQISDPNDRPRDERSRRPDQPPFFLMMNGHWTEGSSLTTGKITPGVERTINFEDVETGPDGIGYRVEIATSSAQRNRVLYGPYSISQS